jgi:serine/threonine-protein kinase
MDKVGRYELRELIGAGAMGRVYKAFDPEIGRTLAIKLLLSELRLNEEYRLRFLREARGAGVLSHPNIVTVFDAGEQDSAPYIAMEYVEGGTLADVLKKGERVPVETVVEIGIQLARALDYAHEHGIVHRDVKPSNIMMVAGTRNIKVADFGICRIDTGDATRRTRMGEVLGTPHYMSPEQVVGEHVDARSDLFSAGVVLYQLLCGALPFEGDTFVTVALKIAKSDPTSIDRVRPDLPLSLRRIVDRALKKQPDKRFQRGRDLAEALVGVARELAESGARRSRPRRIPLGVKWAAAMAALVVVTMGLTAAMIYTRQYGAMLDQVLRYGGSLAKFMASQNAVPLLAEDWAAMEVFIQATTSRQDFGYLVVVDHGGTIRGSNQAAQVGTKYTPVKGTTVPNKEGMAIVSHAGADGRVLLDFAAPVLFQNKEVGAIHLGIFQAPLVAVANLVFWLLALLTAVTAAAVAIGSYLLAQRLATPVRVLRNSLQELAKGHYDYRIADTRKDEFGELFAAFDTTAASLQQRHEAPAAQTVPPATSHPQPTTENTAAAS